VGTSKIMGGQGLHNKPIGCGASGARASGPDDEEEEEEEEEEEHNICFRNVCLCLEFLYY
jgi:hypothetical protein